MMTFMFELHKCTSDKNCNMMSYLMFYQACAHAHARAHTMSTR